MSHYKDRTLALTTLIRHSAARRDLPLLVALVVLSHLPFLWRPFHIDDRIYLEISRQAAHTPLYPQDYRPVFEGKHGPDAASHSHPPLISYLLALLRRFRGREDEFFFHSAFLVFPILLGIGTYLLALHQTRFPLAVALLVVWNPATYVLSQSLMTDVPFVALYTLGIALSTWKEERREGFQWLAAATLSLATMMNYLALSAIPLLAVARWQKQRLVSRLWPVMILPLLCFAGWVGLQSFHYHRFILAATGKFLTTEGNAQWFLLGEKLLSTLLNVGGMLLVLCLFYRHRRSGWLLWLALTLVTAMSVALWIHWHWLHSLLLGLFVASGVCSVKEALAGHGDDATTTEDVQWTTDRDEGTSTSNALLLRLWLLGFLATCILVYYHGSVRYVLPIIVPAVVLLASRSACNQFKMTASVAATLIYAILLAHADYRFASIYPPIAEQAFRDYSGSRIWATGEWGFRYYIERKGGQTLVREDQRPNAGDILIKPALAMPYVTGYDNDEHVDLLRQEFVFLPNPIRLLDFSSHAGFYSTGWGMLPWSLQIEHSPVEIFTFFRIKKRFQGDPSSLRQDYFR
ncbi:MAG: hypothetical protein HY644_14375 [Acidobacteria bacterium]|nr:hypothetical protein [Acidobacteriota bacterium]